MPGPLSRLRLAPYATPAALALIILPPCASRAQTPQSRRDAQHVEIQMRQRALWDLEKLKNPSTPAAKVPNRKVTERGADTASERSDCMGFSSAIGVS